MDGNSTRDRGPPAAKVDAKRPIDKVSVSVDWHDYLCVRRVPGISVPLNFVFRPFRAQATGLQYRCISSGVTSSKPFESIRWGSTAGSQTREGILVWSAEGINSESMRAPVDTDAWVADDGLTLSNESSDDSTYTVFVTGGVSGQTYEIRHTINLGGPEAESKEALIILPVRD